ncbi:MAG: GAF domain-containing protein [Oscillatoriales cyanobacterium RM2_1_1]|nr:GAF domain-containing protein [Oscillatoriales cyanobacterium SM2_3_0]NJO45917.1 GAF domain-containing protein [Oscillatoriales cyanobacterium RM2_1_1]
MQYLDVNQLSLLNRMTSRIRQSLELPEILDTTVAEVRAFLKTDRVKIYKFDGAGNGQVIAESIRQDCLPSLKGLNFPASDIPPQARELFLKARVRSIVDVHQQEIYLSEPERLPSTATGELTLTEVQQQPLETLLQRPVDPCHVEYLTLMGVQSSLVIPILAQNQLWGLLISHNIQPQTFCENQLEVVQMIAAQVEIAIAQSHLLRQAREKARQEAIVNQVSTLLHTPLDTQQRLEIVLQQIVNAFQASSGILCLNDGRALAPNCYVQGYIQGPLQIWQDYSWPQLLSMANLQMSRVAVDNLELNSQTRQLASLLAETSIRGVLSVPIQYSQEHLGNLTIFRDAIEAERLWAGYQAPDPRQARPRQSFEEWREIIRGQSLPWTKADCDLLESLGNQVALAAMQERLYRQEQKQRILVEMRNSELHQARQIAEEANRLKSDFLSSTSHELRTPLASTLNYLKLLKEQFYDNEIELQEYIEAAHSAAESLTFLINDILDIAKIEAGQMSVDWQKVSLKLLLKQEYSLFKVESLKRDINLKIDCPINTIVADENKLRQVLTNLLSNAFKFTEAGEVSLTVSPQIDTDPVMILFEVRDTGIGIDLAKHPQLFEAFVQEDGSIRRRYGGTGLGLAICKKLVELMGGQIWLESLGKGKGTTVKFTIPNLDTPNLDTQLKGG